MIINKSQPFSKEEIEKLQEAFGIYIKTVIDIDKQICSAGASRHVDSEEILLREGSKQQGIWGGGIDLITKIVDFNSFINIRPSQDNPSNEIQDNEIRKQYELLTKYFFKELYD